MKKSLLPALFSMIFVHALSQENNLNSIAFNGFYIAKTGGVAAAKVDIYTYLRFYKDGSVCLQSVTSYDPQNVAGWFGRFKKFSQKGIYQVIGNEVLIHLTNNESKDFTLEGKQETTFKGSMQSGNQLCLKRGDESNENCFAFTSVNDTTKFKYAPYKPEIILPGEWKVKQVLKSNGQIFFTNEDSTIVALSVFIASKLPVYKEGQTEFETAYAYYDWDSKYMKEEEKMEVKKITENTRKSFVIWNAKDSYNDNNFLFARHKDLLYNIMVFDQAMPLEKQLILLESLYDLNKE